MASENLYLENYQPSTRLGRSTRTKLPIVLSGTAATLAVGGTMTVTGTSTFNGAVTFPGGVTSGTNFQVSFVDAPTATATDRFIFVAPVACQVLAASEVHAVAAGGASAIQLTKDVSTNAPGAGTNLLTNNTNSGFDLNGTANTVQVGTLSATLTDLQLAVGDRLALDWANTIQSTAGMVVTVWLKTI